MKRTAKHVSRQRSRPRVSLEQTQEADFAIEVVCPKLFVGLGTTARRCLLGVLTRLESRFGMVPNVTQFAIIDADANGMKQYDPHGIGLGIDGGGTDPVLGL